MTQATPDDAPGRARPWLAAIASLAIHAAVVGLITTRTDDDSDEHAGDPFGTIGVDVEIAPPAPAAEALPAGMPEAERRARVRAIFAAGASDGGGDGGGGGGNDGPGNGRGRGNR